MTLGCNRISTLDSHTVVVAGLAPILLRTDVKSDAEADAQEADAPQHAVGA